MLAKTSDGEPRRFVATGRVRIYVIYRHAFCVISSIRRIDGRTDEQKRTKIGDAGAVVWDTYNVFEF